MNARAEERRLVTQVPVELAALLDLSEDEMEVHQEVPQEDTNRADLLIHAAGQTFVVEVSGSATAGPVAARAERAAIAAKRLRKRAIPLVVVPFMSDLGRQACQRAGVSWFDLSGNAHITAPGIKIIIDGRPNRFRGPGRPASVFAPKSSRVARWLLMHPDQALTQREIARSTDMSEGFVSRIVSRLLRDGYVTRDKRGALRVKEPQLLLGAWREQYRFSKHTIIQGHVAARSGDALARFVSDTLVAEALEHAATGLAAAWQLTRFAAFRIATFFVAREPPDKLAARLGFRRNPRGANLWLVVPSDAGVFDGAEVCDGIRCVHPVQAYLDLKEHPERAADAAERLRAEHLSW